MLLCKLHCPEWDSVPTGMHTEFREMLYEPHKCSQHKWMKTILVIPAIIHHNPSSLINFLHHYPPSFLIIFYHPSSTSATIILHNPSFLIIFHHPSSTSATIILHNPSSLIIPIILHQPPPPLSSINLLYHPRISHTHHLPLSLQCV